LTVRQLFVGVDGRLRALWRVVVFLVVAVLAVNLVAFLFGPIVNEFFTLVGIQGVSSGVWNEALGTLLATGFVLRYVEQRSWDKVWLGAFAARPVSWIVGFAIGALAIGLPIVALIVAHWLKEAGSPATASWIGAGTRVSLFLAPAALFEELLVRGYLLSVLRDAWGWAWAIVATSVGFGLLHLQNNGANVQSLTLVMLAGFFLAAVLYATRSLYAAWMAHFAWNWTMAVAFHTAVSGIPLEAPGYRYVDAGPDWATGGEWGPEGGLLGGAGMVGGATVSYLLARRRRSPTSPDAGTTSLNS
jgi:membrane protease YdiL (CAAX protease family)